MSFRRLVEDRLRESGLGPLDDLARMPGVGATPVFTITLAADGTVLVTRVPACDTAIHFVGLHCPFEGVTLLIEEAVVAKWRPFDSKAVA